MKEETQWKYTNKKAGVSDSSDIQGLLCPHVYIKDNKGQILSLRGLADYLYRSQVSQDVSDPENFYIVLRFKADVGKIVEKQAQQVIDQQVIKGRILEVKILENTHHQIDKEGLDKHTFYSIDRRLLFEKLQCREPNVVIIRPDSTVVAKL